MIGAINPALTLMTTANKFTKADDVSTESTAASAKSLLTDPVTYAVAGGAVLAAVGGWMLFKGKRRRR